MPLGVTPGRICRVVAGAALALAIGVSGLPAKAMVLFDENRELALPSPAVFPRFTDMVKRYTSQYQSMTSACTTGSSPFCDYIGRWAQLMRDVQPLSRAQQIERVNAMFNSFAYITDWQNWNLEDYWATPLQFYDVDGDCEDYAIAKYYTLRGLGITPDVMRIVVLFDQNLQLHHAVLAVNTGSDILILDNQISGVVSASRIAHYTPIMSINEAGAWRHR
jgi:predicted transglutaminase-like cysteine proteinase